MSEKYEFIDAECATLPAEGEASTVVQMCEWLGVSKSGFYDWRTRPLSETAQRRELLEIKIKALFEANNSEYGYRRIDAALVRGGESVDDETVNACQGGDGPGEATTLAYYVPGKPASLLRRSHSPRATR